MSNKPNDQNNNKINNKINDKNKPKIKNQNSGNINDQINNLYKGSTLFEKYGLDVWLTIVIIIILILANVYFYILNHIHTIRVNWPKYRCNPFFMPFAGFINNKKNDDYPVLSNFNYCITNILQTTSSIAVDPINYMLDAKLAMYSTLSNIANSFRQLIAYLRKAFSAIYQDVLNRTMNIVIPLYTIVVKLKDTLGKLAAILTSGLFTLITHNRLMYVFLMNFGTILMLNTYLPMLLVFIFNVMVARYKILAGDFQIGKGTSQIAEAISQEGIAMGEKAQALAELITAAILEADPFTAGEGAADDVLGGMEMDESIAETLKSSKNFQAGAKKIFQGNKNRSKGNTRMRYLKIPGAILSIYFIFISSLIDLQNTIYKKVHQPMPPGPPV